MTTYTITSFDMDYLDGDPDPYYLVDVLTTLDDMYHNNDEPFVTDGEYDAIRRIAHRMLPHHKYFTGIGSEVRGGKTKLPYPLGSLDQIEIGDIQGWVVKWNLFTETGCITDKLDGTSALVIYDKSGKLQIAYSRGDGIEGADITRHIKRFAPTSIGVPKAVRGEVILSKKNFEFLKTRVMSRSGKPYRNARNMVAGVMNAETNDDLVYQYLEFIAYEDIGNDTSKELMLDGLKAVGFSIPYFDIVLGKDLTDAMLATYLNKRRSVVGYEIDGIVIDVNGATKRKQMNPSKDTLNPAYAIKYKVADASNLAETIVRTVHWNISKDGYFKPRVEFEPVDLMGVTITFATGFNAKFIVDNKIGPGAKIEITRTGDVIPYIKSVVTGATPEMPSEPYVWIDNAYGEVDIALSDPESSDDVQINRIAYFFDTIGAPHIRKGSIIKLYNAILSPLQSIDDIIRATKEELEQHIGSNGSKIYYGIRKALTNIPAWKLMGATHFFGRGVGTRRFKALIGEMGYSKMIAASLLEITNVDKFDVTIGSQIINGMPDYLDWIKPFVDDELITIEYDSTTISTDSALSGMNVVFTGFRNNDLQKRAEQVGANFQTTVSSKTNYVVAADPNSTSTKLKKARDLGVKVIAIDEFEVMI